MPRKGVFIVLDGPDGCGKTTQAGLLSGRLGKERGIRVTLVRDPGGTRIGEALRGIILDPKYSEMAIEAELLLYMASRAQLAREVIAPALERGDAVVADRFISSSVAYQGVAGGVPVDTVMEIGRFALSGLSPDLTVILDIPASAGMARKKGARDRIESREIRFHDKVREGFLEAAAVLGPGARVIDAAQEAGRVAEEIMAAVDDALGKRVGAGNRRGIGH